jgi:hypothetical protein
VNRVEGSEWWKVRRLEVDRYYIPSEILRCLGLSGDRAFLILQPISGGKGGQVRERSRLQCNNVFLNSDFRMSKDRRITSIWVPTRGSQIWGRTVNSVLTFSKSTFCVSS